LTALLWRLDNENSGGFLWPQPNLAQAKQLTWSS